MTRLPADDDPFAELFRRRGGVYKLGLERMESALRALELPRDVPRIIVAGTNGKGTTAGMLAAILASAGERVGLYSSPHIEAFRERYHVSHIPVSDQLLLEEWAVAERRGLSLSFFEQGTLLAHQVFRRLGTTIDIFEVGLGGRLDACNVGTPAAAAVVSVGWDHQEFLGSTLGAIAGEKLAVARPGVPLVLGFTPCDEGVERAIRETAGRGTPLRRQAEHFSHAGGSYRGDGATLEMPAAWRRAPYWEINFATAAELARLVLGKLPRAVDPAFMPPSLRCRMERTNIPRPDGTLQPVLLDGAHNLPAIAALREALTADRPRPALVTMMADKDLAALLPAWRQIAAPLIAFGNPHDRSWQAGDLPPAYRQEIPFAVTWDEAWALACRTFPADCEWLISGSLMGLAAPRSCAGT